MNKKKHISLFSGIGGFDLAAEWMGWENVAHCEWNPFGQRVLKHYWPNAISYHDIPRQISLFTEEPLMYLQGGSPASPIAKQANGSGKKMSATSGQRCLEQFGRLPRAGSWAKTFAALLIGMEGWYSTKCRLTWKLKGTKYNRFYFQLRVSTLPMKDTESGLLLSTPAANPMGNVTPERAQEMGWIWKGNSYYRPDGSKVQTTLGHQVLMLPTPMASDCGEKVTGLENQDSLTKRARHLTGETSQLNPRFVMEMMGFPPSHCDNAFEKIAWELYQKKKLTKSFQKRLRNGVTNPSKQGATP